MIKSKTVGELKELLSKYSDDRTIKIYIDDDSSIYKLWNLDSIQELPGIGEEVLLKGTW